MKAGLRRKASILLVGIFLLSRPGFTDETPQSKGLSGHATRGLLNLTLMGFQLGTGLGLRTQEPNPDKEPNPTNSLPVLL